MTFPGSPSEDPFEVNPSAENSIYDSQIPERAPDLGFDSSSPLSRAEPFEERQRPLRVRKARLIQGSPHEAGGDFQFPSGPNAAPNKIDLLVPEALQARMLAGAPIVNSLILALVICFFYSISGKDWSSYFWWSMLGDRGLIESDLIERGAMTISSIGSWVECPRLILSLFQHSGPWSLVLLLTILFSAGRFLERLLGGGQTVFLFLISGIVGNYVTLSAAASMSGYFFIAGAWAGCFGLLGARGSLSRRGIAKGVPVYQGRGILGALFMVWLISIFHFFPQSADPRTLAPIAMGLMAAAVTGAVTVRLLPAWVDDPEGSSGCLSGLFLFLSLLILGSAFIVWFIEPDPMSRRPSFPSQQNPNRPFTGQQAARPGQEKDILSGFKKVSDKKLSFLVQIPNDWKELRRGDGFVTYGTRGVFGAYSTEELYLYIRDRHPYDAPDTLVGRFLNMAVNDWHLRQSDLTILDDEAFDHPKGKAHRAIYRLHRGSRNIQAGIQRCYYLIIDEQVFLFLFWGKMDDLNGEISGAVVRSVKILEETEDKKKD
jgi:membrane associated rhomboid family serine protease